MDAFAAHRQCVPLSADLFLVRGGGDPLPRRLGRKLDGGRAYLPVRALGRAWLGPGAAGDQDELLVAAVALWRLERRLSRAA